MNQDINFDELYFWIEVTCSQRIFEVAMTHPPVSINSSNIAANSSL